MTKKKLKEAPEAERLPFTPEDAIERLREVLRMLESVTDDKGRVDARSPLPKARVYLRGIIGCGIADVRDYNAGLDESLAELQELFPHNDLTIDFAARPDGWRQVSIFRYAPPNLASTIVVSQGATLAEAVQKARDSVTPPPTVTPGWKPDSLATESQFKEDLG